MWPDVNDKLIEIEFNDANLLTRTLKITEDEKSSVSNGKKAKGWKYNEVTLNYEPSFFRNSGSFPRRMRRAVDFIAFTLQKNSLCFETYEIPPGIHDVGDNFRENQMKAIASIDIIPMNF